MSILRMTDLDLAGKRVLIRQDLNVPIDGGRITSEQRITASLPTMTVTEPVVASALGVIVLGETLHPDGLGWFGLAVAVVVMVVATAALARGEAITAAPPTSTSQAGHPC